MRKFFYSQYIVLSVFVIVVLFTIFGCANRGVGPQGGPVDITPPKLVKSNPVDKALNVNSSSVELYFNEIVLLEGAFEKVIVSPPQSEAAVMKALGHKVRVELQDSLRANTTYTIDFSDAIVDNNEKNKLENFSFSFSTGDHIDTLKISGIVIDAENLNPVPDILVGIHSDLSDSVFTSRAFDRITRTDKTGRFCVNNVAEGKYRVYALKDIGNNYYFDIPTEKIAFLDSVYTPLCESVLAYDTIYSYPVLDSINNIVDSTNAVVDSVITRTNFIYTPDSIILKAFEEKDFRHYMLRFERKEPYLFSLIFSGKCDTLPSIRPLNVPDSIFKYQLQKNLTGDTLTYWLSDTLLWTYDTISVEQKYYRIDLDSSYLRTDTMNLVYRKPKGKKNSKADTPKSIMKSNASQSFDIYNPLILSMSMPTFINDTCSFSLQEKKDTLWIDLPAEIVKSDTLGMSYKIEYSWDPSKAYQLTLDSAMFVALDKSVTKKEIISFKTKSLEEYSTLIFTLQNYQGCEVVQVLNEKDIPVRQLKAQSANVKFEYLTPGKYFARMFMDKNGNGIWDTGNYRQNIQPEEVFYFPYELELRAFWDVEETWDIDEMPLIEQKSDVLINSSNKQ